MIRVLRLKRGDTATNNDYLGREGEIVLDNQAHTIVIHDGVKQGGYRLASEGNFSLGNLTVVGSLTVANVNLGNLLDTATYYSGEPMVVRMPNALLAEIRPYTMSDRNKISMATWEQMNHMNQVDNDKTADATKKLKEASLGVGKLIAVTMDIVCNSVIKVTTPDGAEVTDPKFIKEWVTNLEKADFDIIDRGIKDLMNMGVSKEMHLKCENCGAEFTSAINFNPSDFFAQGLPS